MGKKSMNVGHMGDSSLLIWVLPKLRHPPNLPTLSNIPPNPPSLLDNMLPSICTSCLLLWDLESSRDLKPACAACPKNMPAYRSGHAKLESLHLDDAGTSQNCYLLVWLDRGALFSFLFFSILGSLLPQACQNIVYETCSVSQKLLYPFG